MKLFLVALIVISSGLIHAQDRSTYRWYFGDKQGLDFNTSPPTIVTDGQSAHMEGTSVASDPVTGTLLFYTDGNTIWNRNHGVMAKDINPFGVSSSQSALIVRQPGSGTLYHLFTTTRQAWGPGRHFIIDLSLNGGLGGLLFSDTNVTKSLVAEKVTAVAAANGYEYWILFRKIGTGTPGFLAYSLGSNGLNALAVESHVGIDLNYIGSGVNSIGCMRVTPNAKTLVSANNTDDVEIFDFNNTSGIVSNPRVLHLNALKQCYGVEFSASGRYVYVNYEYLAPNDTLVRFDLLANDVQSTKLFVGACPQCLFGQMDLGPDGKIYVADCTRKCLSTITNPDAAQPLFNDSAITLPGKCLLGLPNFPPKVSDPGALATLLSSDYACVGGTISYQIRSRRADSLVAYVKFEDGSSRTLSGTDSVINFTRKIAARRDYFVQVIVRVLSAGQLSAPDTLTAQTNGYLDCCGNVIRNGNFYEIAAGGQCFTEEYDTDMDFRTSTTLGCVYTVSVPGQLASHSQAVFGNPNWEGTTHSMPGGFMLYGETVPNLAQRAWIQKVPVWKNRRYQYQAFVKNVEKIPRWDTTGCSLHFFLVAKQNNRIDTVSALHNVRFSDGWLSLSGSYQPQSDDQVELAVVVLYKGLTKLSFGFAIDDISFSAIPYLQLHVADTSVCRGSAVMLPATAVGAVSQRWTPSTGLSNDTLLQPIAVPNTTTLYHIVAYDTNGCEAQDSVLVRVKTPQPFILFAQKHTLCQGDSLFLRVHEGFTNVRWSDGSTDSVFVVHQAGSYYAQALDQFGCAIHSDTVKVTLQSDIGASAWLPDSLAVYAGQIVSVPIILQRSADVLQGSSFVAHLRYRSQVLLSDSTVTVRRTDGEWTYIDVSGIVQLSDTIAVLRMQGLLDIQRMSEIIIDSIGFSNSCSVSLKKKPGRVFVQACWIGGSIVIRDVLSAELALYPNPADESVVAVLSSVPEDDITVELYNTIGEREREFHVSHATQHSNAISIDLSMIAPGLHRIVVRCKGTLSSGLVCKR